VVLACVVAALAISPQARAQLGDVAAYAGWNLIFLNFMQPELPGLFDLNRFTEVNGALWTLKIEVMFYAVLPLLAWLLRACGRQWWVLALAIYLGAEAWRLGLAHVGHTSGPGFLVDLSYQLPGQMSFFISGVALLRLKDHIAWNAGFVLRLVAALAVSLAFDWAEPLRAAALAGLVAWIGLKVRPTVDAARFGDLSYGVYIAHFPFVQGLVAAGLFASSPLLGAGAALAGSLGLALALWWSVERPALRIDSPYRLRGSPHARLPT
jgi:peptidoglycan/LPS O-acetylase OafA/YrhL